MVWIGIIFGTTFSSISHPLQLIHSDDIQKEKSLSNEKWNEHGELHLVHTFGCCWSECTTDKWVGGIPCPGKFPMIWPPPTGTGLIFDIRLLWRKKKENTEIYWWIKKSYKNIYHIHYDSWRNIQKTSNIFQNYFTTNDHKSQACRGVKIFFVYRFQPSNLSKKESNLKWCAYNCLKKGSQWRIFRYHGVDQGINVYQSSFLTIKIENIKIIPINSLSNEHTVNHKAITFQTKPKRDCWQINTMSFETNSGKKNRSRKYWVYCFNNS